MTATNTVYQPTAGRLRINSRDYSLEDVSMDWYLKGTDVYITLECKTYPSNFNDVLLSSIKDNLGRTYANITAWLAWWDALDFGAGVTATVTGGATEAKQDTALTEAQTLRGKQFPNVGIHVLTGTGAATAGTYTGFVVLEEAAISSITLTDSNKVTGTNDFSGITLSVGTFIEIPGGFSTLTLSAGSMILIKGA